MSKNRDLIYDMTDAPETEDFVQFDSEPLQLGGRRRGCARRKRPSGDDAWRRARCAADAHADRRARCASLRCACRT